MTLKILTSASVKMNKNPFFVAAWIVFIPPISVLLTEDCDVKQEHALCLSRIYHPRYSCSPAAALVLMLCEVADKH